MQADLPTNNVSGDDIEDCGQVDVPASVPEVGEVTSSGLVHSNRFRLSKTVRNRHYERSLPIDTAFSVQSGIDLVFAHNPEHSPFVHSDMDGCPPVAISWMLVPDGETKITKGLILNRPLGCVVERAPGNPETPSQGCFVLLHVFEIFTS